MTENRRYVCVGVLVSLFMGIFLLTFVVGIFIVGNRSEGKVLKSEKNFQYLMYDPATDITTDGTVSNPKELGDKGFVTYKDTLGRHVLISKFGSTRFKCYGSCVCESVSNRRSANILSRGMIVLVAATSSLVAMKLANKEFEGYCESEASEEEECSPDSICTMVDEHGQSHNLVPDDLSQYKDEYLCSGNCHAKNVLVAKKLAGLDLTDEQFEKLQVRINEEDCHKKTYSLQFKPEEPSAPEVVFLMRHLSPWCEENSQPFEGEMKWYYHGSDDEEFFPFCTGLDWAKVLSPDAPLDAKAVDMNPSVVCKKVK